MVYTNSFEFSMAALGGLILSFTCILNLFLKGRITGISGIFYGAISLNSNYPYHFSFILGMLFLSSLFRLSFSAENTNFFEAPKNFVKNLSLLGFFLSSILVGFGTRLANGCTSGHGLNGIARFSIRSFLSVFIFMAFSIMIATLRYNFNFFYENQAIEIAEEIWGPKAFLISFIIFSVVLFFYILFLCRQPWEKNLEFLISFVLGILFSLGLIISGMNKRSKVINFLTIKSDWDPSLIFVLFTGVGFNAIFFYIIKRNYSKPILAEKFSEPKKKEIDLRLIIGSAIFGIGWGISGICPGPLIVDFYLYIPHLLIFMTGLIIGMFLVTLLDYILEKCNSKNTKNEKSLTNEEKKIEGNKNEEILDNIDNNDYDNPTSKRIFNREN